MDFNKVIELLEDLPASTGLDSEDHWEDGPIFQKWRLEAMEAIRYAVNVLETGKVVGLLELNGKTYKIMD
ncbi:hypothetical protein [Bacillus salipaludis]|uniref:Uncharacterized protein n=1 Tax=Bacillus salipaludis TaxID=2547811 RepID=A0AA90R861_9BACI|nr:hypothetical protein [Bacillus salipaludis]MDQ6598068.1 hypothetical protein [Bacillus salipaludis]